WPAPVHPWQQGGPPPRARSSSASALRAPHGGHSGTGGRSPVPQAAAAPRPAAPRTHRSPPADWYRFRRQGRWGPPAGRRPVPGPGAPPRARPRPPPPGPGTRGEPGPPAGKGGGGGGGGGRPRAARRGRGLQLPALRGAALRRRRPRKRKRLPREPTSPSGRSMNGSVAGGGGFSEEVISLTRRPSGLGFNIVGGTDQQYICNDSSIYVSRIKKDGAAYLDGRLQEGDKILAVNGRDLKDLRHKDAVELFRNAGYDVSLKIQRRLQPQNGPVGHQGDGESGGLPLAAILVPGLALAAAAVWILLRYRQRM
uniref:Synaptojanin-2-binding protein n=2 Tax=Aquila chrysaetos chrysaetos TaxID=223781 RepID=A0A663E3V5_AQUCH